MMLRDFPDCWQYKESEQVWAAPPITPVPQLCLYLIRVHAINPVTVQFNATYLSNNAIVLQADIGAE